MGPMVQSVGKQRSEGKHPQTHSKSNRTREQRKKLRQKEEVVEKSGRSEPMETKGLVPQKGLVKETKKEGGMRWDVRNKWDFMRF